MIDNLSDVELTENIKNDVDVNDSLMELRDRHSGIFYKKANAYSGIMEIEDLKENTLSFFYEAAKEFDVNKSKFSTWVGNKAFWTCQSLYSSNRQFVEIEEAHLVEHPNYGEKELKEYVENSIQNDEDKKILEKRLSGMTFSEIAKDMNDKYSGEWVRQKYNRILDRYKQILNDE